MVSDIAAGRIPHAQLNTTFTTYDYKNRILIEGWIDNSGPKQFFRWYCKHCDYIGQNSTETGCKIGGGVHWQSKHSRIPLKTWANDVFEKRNIEIDDMAEYNRNG